MGYAKYRTGDYPGALAAYADGLAIARKLAEVEPNAGKQRDIALLVASIGDTKLDSGDNAGALAAYRESLAIRQQLAAADPATPI